MEAMEDIEIETDLQTQSLLLAASNHDISALRNLLRNSSANVQDAETGFTPLHAAIAACEPDEETDGEINGVNGQANGHNDASSKPGLSEAELKPAIETVKLLFQNGAIWNDLDANNETPGCIAHRLGLKELYEMIVDAGVRAELLLNRLDEYQLLGEGGDDDEEEEEDDEEEEAEETAVTNSEEETLPEVTAAVTDSSANPTESEEQVAAAAESEEKRDVNSEDYLSSVLRYTDNSLLDSDNNGVMMSWETDIMRRTSELLAPKEGLRVLNVGFGMGIIDDFFQEKFPVSHHIIEAHPAVLEKIKMDGWHEKTGIVVHEGRWQDTLPDLLETGDIKFDAIYFDTFAEDYKALRDFFSEYAVELLAPEGRFGFFNGLGADRQVCYDVYTKIVEMDLFEAGFDTEWENIAVPDLQSAGEWNGVRRRYWVPETYRLPTCTPIG